MFARSLFLALASVLCLSLQLQSEVSAQPVVNALQALNAKIDAQVVPFKAESTTAGLCDSAGSGTSTPEIQIDSDGEAGEFVITSIMIRTVAPGIPETGFNAFSINHVDIDGERLYTRTGSLLGPTDGFGVFESVDIMGTPVRRNGDSDNPVAGGNFPHQIVAQSAGSNDVAVAFFCSTTDDDVSFDYVLVAGWKRPADTITVTFVPGS